MCRSVLILTDRREHAYFLHDVLPESGLYLGGMKKDELQESSQRRIIIGTFSLAQEGLDIPKLDTAVFATPKSDVVQAAGRILRGGSSYSPVIYDIVDSGLYGMFKKRCVQYSEMKFLIAGSDKEDRDDKHKDEMYWFD